MNPFLKSLITLAAGGALAGVDQAISTATPTGGFAHTLTSYGLLPFFAGGLLLAHNYITQVEARMGIHPAQTSG